ncbi:unnamed protein product [Rotaria socialis]|uniref:F-box domain-containing protein n=1 Tax=Rotaria socialis TaxID=392032 RepID=A0A818ZC05_9BILA|nr:unnamed protein product [Rotaria socialis]
MINEDSRVKSTEKGNKNLQSTLSLLSLILKENDWIYVIQKIFKAKNQFEIFHHDHYEKNILGRQQISDIFPNNINATTSALRSLHLNTDHEQVSKIYTLHPYPPAARMPRIVKIPLKNKVPFPTRHIRLEFDHSTTNYYIEIDTIKLCGDLLNTNQSAPAQTIQTQEENREGDSQNSLASLPFDLLFLIVSYLDLRSLMQLSSTCRNFRELCLDPLQFHALNLKPYWNGITNDAIQKFFLDHCVKTRYLSLAWTKSIAYESFNQLLITCSHNLAQLDLGCCSYLKGEYIQVIGDCCPNIEILNLENCSTLQNQDFLPLRSLHRIRSLNVYRTRIDYQTLLPLIDSNKEHLEHINLGSCQNLIDTVGIVKLLFARCSNLRSLDLWRVAIVPQSEFLSMVGLPYDSYEEERRIANLREHIREQLAIVYSLVNMPVQITSMTHMVHLSEIDIGWTDPPPGFIKRLVQQAGHSLIKIFLTACRRISNEDIVAVSENCLQLRQLDVLGSRVIQEASIECILKRCVHIEFVDISFCSEISDEAISIWIGRYKNCFKRSYQPITRNSFRNHIIFFTTWAKMELCCIIQHVTCRVKEGRVFFFESCLLGTVQRSMVFTV